MAVPLIRRKDKYVVEGSSPSAAVTSVVSESKTSGITTIEEVESLTPVAVNFNIKTSGSKVSWSPFMIKFEGTYIAVENGSVTVQDGEKYLLYWEKKDPGKVSVFKYPATGISLPVMTSEYMLISLLEAHGETLTVKKAIYTPIITSELIQANSILSDHIKAGELQVGKNIFMAEGATISWGSVDKTGASAADVKARDENWKPTPGDIGALPVGWLPTLTEIGAMALDPTTPTNIGQNWLYTGTVYASQIVADSISAISANLGSVTAGNISGVNISGSSFSTDLGQWGLTLDGNGFKILSNQGDLGWFRIAGNWIEMRGAGVEDSFKVSLFPQPDGSLGVNGRSVIDSSGYVIQDTTHRFVTDDQIYNWNNSFGASHSHDNKAVLDDITQLLVNQWNSAYTNNHTHSNKANLDTINQNMGTGNSVIFAGLALNGTFTINNSTLVTNLNADYLQGLHASSFGQNYALSENADLNAQINSGFYRLAGTHSNAPASYSYSQMLVVHGVSDTIAQMLFDYQGSGYYIRSGNPTNVGGSGTWNPWRKLWHDGNDGTGSGLDADLWQGWSRSTYLDQAVKTTSNVNFNMVQLADYLLLHGHIYSYANINLRNKADSGWIGFAVRNTFGSEAVYDLSNIGTIALNGDINFVNGSARQIYTSATNGSIDIRANGSGGFNFGYNAGSGDFIYYGGSGVSKFSVNSSGSATFGGNLTVNGSSVNNFAGYVQVKKSNYAYINASSTNNNEAGFGLYNNDTPVWFLYKPNGSTDLRFFNGSGDVFTFTSTGNLTTSGNLTVNGSGDNIFKGAIDLDGSYSIIKSTGADSDLGISAKNGTSGRIVFNYNGGSGGISMRDGTTNETFAVSGAGNITSNGIGNNYFAGSINVIGDIKANYGSGNIFARYYYDSANNLVLMTDSGKLGVGTTTLTERLNINGNTKQWGDYYQSGNVSLYNNFTSGWSGSGWRLDYGVGVSGASSAEVDYLTVRRSMNVYELLIRQIRATNGNVFVTACGKIKQSGLGGADTQWSFIETDDPTGHNLGPFKYGDILLVQKVNLDGVANIKYVFAVVQGDVNNQGSWGSFFTDANTKNRRYVVNYSVDGTTWNWNGGSGQWFETGEEVVRIGSEQDSARRGSVYLSSDDSNSPFLRVIDGVSAASQWGSSSKIKFQAGKLDGLTDAVLGALSGFGVYTQRLYLSSMGAGTNAITMVADNNTARLTLQTGGNAIFDFNTATSTAKIANWKIEGTQLSSTNGRMFLRGGDSPNILLRKDNADNGNYIYQFYNNADSWGIEGYVGGSEYFRLGNENRIAGFNFTDQYLNRGNIYIGNYLTDLQTQGNVLFGNLLDGSYPILSLIGSESMIRIAIDDVYDDTEPKAYIGIGPAGTSIYNVQLGDLSEFSYGGTGIRITNSDGTQTLMCVSSEGTQQIGGINFYGTGLQSQVYDSTHGFQINSDGSAIFNNVIVRGEIHATTGSFTGNIISSATITGGTFATNSVNKRITLNEGNANQLRFYNSTNNTPATLEGFYYTDTSQSIIKSNSSMWLETLPGYTYNGFHVSYYNGESAVLMARLDPERVVILKDAATFSTFVATADKMGFYVNGTGADGNYDNPNCYLYTDHSTVGLLKLKHSLEVETSLKVGGYEVLTHDRFRGIFSSIQEAINDLDAIEGDYCYVANDGMYILWQVDWFRVG